MHAISQVLENYLPTYRANLGVSLRNGSADEHALLETLPNFFRALLVEQGRQENFKVEGSYGNGNMPKVPWVGIFNNLVTTSAQEGYYIVLLFSEDMQSCYLSLNQGVTELKTQFGQNLACAKMVATASRALNFFHVREDSVVGKINLNASSHLGKGYESGAIESHKYEKNFLPTDFILAEDFLSLVDHYDRLVASAGPSLQFLAPVTEDEFHQAALRKAVTPSSISLDIIGPLPIPSLTNTSHQKFARNVLYAAFALRRAGFRCEIDCDHPTFLAQAGNRGYVEAHHLIPISKQILFNNSLDHPANIVSLCTNCHKLLHHGRVIDKRAHLTKLLHDRRKILENAGIFIAELTLLSYYSRTLLEQE